jgi:hypothetical protein
MRTELQIFVLLLAAAATTGPTFARERATGAGDPRGFSLLPAATCEEAQDVRQCRAACPKEWSAEDRRVIHDTMRRLTGHELVRGLFVGARDNGYNGLRRYSTGTEDDPTFGPVATFNPGFVLYPSKVIGLTDAFFQTEQVRDSISDYRFGDFVLVHELIHAFDDRRKSSDRGFTSVTGWVFRNDRWVYANRVNVSDYLGVYAETLTLYASGRYAEAWTRDRSFATSMQVPLPTIQSLVRPDEAFAGILAHLILDSRAITYLKPEVVEWFESNVFPTLRENARRFNAADFDLF